MYVCVNVEAGDIPRGTRVTFRPDPQIFKSTVEFDFDKVALRMDELAYLNAGLSIQMRDFRKPVATGAAAAAMKAAADLATKPEALPVTLNTYIYAYIHVFFALYLCGYIFCGIAYVCMYVCMYVCIYTFMYVFCVFLISTYVP